MKHAYLILAHNEFVILERLIQSIDDERMTSISILMENWKIIRSFSRSMPDSLF